MSIPEGTSTIVFQDLSPEIDEQSIQVKGVGNFTILSVNRQSNFLNEQKSNDEIRQFEEKMTALKDEQEIKRYNNLILKKEEEMLAANQSIGNGGTGLDLNKLKQALDFQRFRLTENKLKQLSNLKEIKGLDDEIKKVESQLKEIKGRSKTNTNDISVKVNAKGPGSGSFKVTYLVKNATWYPTYDIRATDVNKPVELAYRANINQQSGEDWKNVKLVLSSGDPSRGGNRPSLKPYQIGYNIKYYTPGSNITSVSGRITDSENGTGMAGVSVRVKGSSIGTTSNADGYYSIQIPSPNSVLQYAFIGFETVERPVLSDKLDVQLKTDVKSLNEVVVVGYSAQSEPPMVGSALQGKVAGVHSSGKSTVNSTVPLQVEVQQGATTVQFEVEQPYTLTSGGKQLTVELANHQLDADY